MNLKAEPDTAASLLDLEDASAWYFVGGPWKQTDGAWAPAAPPPTAGARAYDGQRCVNEDIHLAFRNDRTHGDFDADFDFR